MTPSRNARTDHVERKGTEAVNDSEQGESRRNHRVGGVRFNGPKLAANTAVVESLSQEGAAGLVHGNRQRRPANALGRRVVKEIVRLARTTYLGINC